MSKNDDMDSPKYVCSCGFDTPVKKEFTSHLLQMGKKEPGVHKSKGLFGPDGNQVLPPDAERTPEQKAEVARVSEENRKKREEEKKKGGKDSSTKVTKTTQQVAQRARTDVLMEATSFRLMPKVYEAPLSPIMIGAREAATNVWGWPKDMSLGDFLDTWLYHSFKAFGITLNTYTVDETVEEESERLRAQEQAEEVPEEETGIPEEELEENLEDANGST